MNPASQFLALPPERRALAFDQAAAQRAVEPPPFVELMQKLAAAEQTINSL